LPGRSPFCNGGGCGFSEGSKKDVMLLLISSTDGIPIDGSIVWEFYNDVQ
jgi:hypothetical protein